MTSATLKKRIMSLLERRSDPYLLAEVHDMLLSQTTTKALRSRLAMSVEEGETDLKAGRSMDLETFEKRLKGSLRTKIAAQSKGRKRA